MWDYIPDICSLCGGERLLTTAPWALETSVVANSGLPELRPCNTLQSGGWKGFIIHCSFPDYRGDVTAGLCNSMYESGAVRGMLAAGLETLKEVFDLTFIPLLAGSSSIHTHTHTFTNMHYSKSSLFTACLSKPPQHGNACCTQRPLISVNRWFTVAQCGCTHKLLYPTAWACTNVCVWVLCEPPT